MLSFLQNILGKSEAKAPAPKVKTPNALELNGQMMSSKVEVANLQLGKILERFPEELRPLVLQMPEETATVALPINTILKQLPTGAVKVSLATLHRQAPVGVLGPLPPGDKRMVDVPLAEVFRHIKPSAFKRRQDQRSNEAVGSEFNLFGDPENPYQIAPTGPETDDAPAAPAPEPAVVPRAQSPIAPPPTRRIAPLPEEVSEEEVESYTPEFKLPPPPTPTAQRMIAPPVEGFEPRAAAPAPAPRGPTLPHAPAPAPEPAKPFTLKLAVSSPAEPAAEPEPEAPAAPPVAEVAPPPAPAPAAAPAAPAAPDEPSVALPLAALSAAWPEEVRAALASLGADAQVRLPSGPVNAGLARGRVSFPWAQLRQWIEPAAPEGMADDKLELALPLKVVAPAFLNLSRKPKAEPKPAFETDIPTLFNGQQAAPAAEAPAVEAPAADAAPAEAAHVAAEAPSLALAEAPEVPREEAPPVAATSPEPAAAETIQVIIADDEPTPAATLEPAAEPPAPPEAEAPEVVAFVEPHAPVAEAPAPVAPPLRATHSPRTVGELFDEPEKTEWTPGELCARVSKLPGISGAVVALQEGLLVAHSMPGDVKSEVIAAFLPQIFARLNQYSAEMKLGDVDDLLFTTHGAHCQIYRLGFVYFAVLGLPGEPLPWADLRLVADELGRQTQLP